MNGAGNRTRVLGALRTPSKPVATTSTYDRSHIGEKDTKPGAEDLPGNWESVPGACTTEGYWGDSLLPGGLQGKEWSA